MTGAELMLIGIWSFLSTRLYRLLYPPRSVLLIYGEHPVAGLMGKIHTRNDRFVIGEIVHISQGISFIKDKIQSYEGVVICDLPSHMRNVILKYCYEKGIRTYTTPKISDVIIRSAESLHLFDTPLLLSRNNGLSFDQRVVKRVMDLALSMTALLFLLRFSSLRLRQSSCMTEGRCFICRNVVQKTEKYFGSVSSAAWW